MFKPWLTFIVCISAIYGLNAGDIDFDTIREHATITLGNECTIKSRHIQENLTAVIEGNGSTLDLTGSKISHTLTLYIKGNNNYVTIQHPNTLKLIVRGEDCHVINRCKEAKGSTIDIKGQASYYITKPGLHYFLFGSPMRTFVTFATVGILALLVCKKL